MQTRSILALAAAALAALAGVFLGGALMVVAAFSRALGPGAPERSAF